MDNENHTPIGYADFLQSPEAVSLFGELDFKLKDGFHFSKVEGQYDFFRFIEKHEESLLLYYQRYFEVPLQQGGEGDEKYYHLEFTGLTRGAIDVDHRYFLKNEYIIIGLLLYKVIFIDKNIELSSIRKFQEAIKRDYEELRPDLYRLLAKAKKETPSQFSDERLDELILYAFKEFEKIGWVKLDSDDFQLFPAFQRLNKVFGEYINTIDDIIKNWSKE
ncbi:condensin complex protein MksE [Puia dinghuensis]|uniref:Uncharacterized protein n=1 Tax=Puia dinghuensis TaxID=1792502 RepID=A0A8J2UI20_9BACT|nr:hypothetical protein [Puia dinghuensis]GGB19939.1 hypothetical protein GCM10011511_49650 [Puia dinghuensis]